MHLILLIGTNPIPNYIAASYGIQKGVTHFHLVHSLENEHQRSTKEIAEALRKELTQNKGIPNDRIFLVPLRDAADKEKIRCDLERELSKIRSTADIILNYTGGTKAMAVHTYTWLSDNSSHALFQYLDARTHRIVTDLEMQSNSSDLRNNDQVSMESIETLLYLHGYLRNDPMENDPFPETTEQLGEMIRLEKIESFLKMTRLLRKIYYDSKGTLLGKKELINQIYSSVAQAYQTDFNSLLRDNHILKECMDTIPAEKSILNTDGTLWIAAETDSNRTYNERIKHVLHDYLDGRWLEHHVMRAIRESVKDKGLMEGKHFGNSLKAIKSNGSRQFELDLFVLRGYQLTGISVTTAGRHWAKGKSFEVMHRSRQIGGDHARGILIADISDEDQVAELEEDINFLLTGSAADSFKVIGRMDWPLNRLTKKLGEIIWD